MIKVNVLFSMHVSVEDLVLLLLLTKLDYVDDFWVQKVKG